METIIINAAYFLPVILAISAIYIILCLFAAWYDEVFEEAEKPAAEEEVYGDVPAILQEQAD